LTGAAVTEVDELNPCPSWIRNLLNLKRGKRIQVQDSRRVKAVERYDKLIPMSSYSPRKIKEAGFEMVKIRAQRKHTGWKEKTLF
jgi:hypothetical protein